jgi:hypothetical protein
MALLTPLLSGPRCVWGFADLGFVHVYSCIQSYTQSKGFRFPAEAFKIYVFTGCNRLFLWVCTQNIKVTERTPLYRSFQNSLNSLRL